MTQSANSSTAREASRNRRRALAATGKTALGQAQSSAVQKQRVKKVAASAPAVSQPVAVSAVVYQGSSKVSSGKAASIARRLAMSGRGKAGVVSKDRSRVAPDRISATAEKKKSGGTCGCGCNGKKSECKASIEKATSAATDTYKSTSAPTVKSLRPGKIKMSSGRAASYARRLAMSKRGKAGIKTTASVAQTARAVNPDMSSRDLAKVVREQRSSKGRCGQKKSEPCGRVRPSVKTENAAAQDAPWKVGASSTSHGQTLTGTMVGRSQQVTGDEPSTCRDVTGTEYLGAEIFNEFCNTDPVKSTLKVAVTTTSHGNAVSGNKIGRGDNVTGNEAGGCKNVTGNEYLAAKESETFCGNKSQKSPAKVSLVETNKKNVMTGSNVGRSDSVTGDESGSNALLTGSQYTKSSKSAGVPSKVGNSKTLRGGSVTGSLLDRSEHVTGNEPGSCRNVSGDDYIGQEQFKEFCEKIPQPKDNKVGASATHQGNTVTGVMTSRSESVTGNEPGTCKSVTGTPYSGT
ncbi:MAG: carboxysome shell protein, partial [Gammaproteobacteria bacterium]|nr:carboxysome shell protein [Gammaproteobacteria bacterium]